MQNVVPALFHWRGGHIVHVLPDGQIRQLGKPAKALNVVAPPSVCTGRERPDDGPE